MEGGQFTRDFDFETLMASLEYLESKYNSDYLHITLRQGMIDESSDIKQLQASKLSSKLKVDRVT